MDNTTLIISGLIGLVLVILIAPRVLAMNQGKIMRNLVLWLAIFAGLGAIYKFFGPFGQHAPIDPVATEAQMPVETTPATTAPDDSTSTIQLPPDNHK